MKESLTSRLKKEMNNRKVKVPQLEAETGIPRDRIYKWLKRQTGNITHEDALLIEKWMNGNMDNVPHEKEDKEHLDKSSLERSIENLTQNELRTTAIIERLVSLLEVKLTGQSIKGLELPTPGTPGTRTLTEKDKVHKKNQP